MTAAELEAACGELGVRFDRARRVYWQRERLFPLAAPANRRPSRGHFHPDAVHLAALVDGCLRRDLPYRPAGARSSLVPLRSLVAEWWLESVVADGDAAQAEQAFYERVRDAAVQLRQGAIPPSLRRDPVGELRPDGADARSPEQVDAMSLAALVAFATDAAHPAKRGSWRLSPEAVGRLVAAWPRIVNDAGDGDPERALGRSVARLASALAARQTL